MKLIIKPRKWQLEALNEWIKNFKGIVKVVTGGGKSVFAMLCIMEYKKKYEKARIVIVVPTISLMDQWVAALMEQLELEENDITCISGLNKPRKINEIIIIVVNTARTYLDKYISHDANIFLIVDECHRLGSIENSKILFREYNATLGLSATPEREYDDSFENILVPTLGKIIYNYDYQQALNDNVICNFNLYNLKIDFLKNEEQDYNRLTRKAIIEEKNIRSGKGSLENLKRILIKRSSISSSAYLRIPITVKIVENNKNKRIIIFHEKINAANQIVKLIEERGFSATIYHSKIGEQLRRNNLALYRKGIYSVLVTCKALDEGLNIPDTDLAIISSSTASTRQRIQRLGRVLRQTTNKKNAEIYTLYVSKAEELRLQKEELQINEISNIIWLRSSIGKNTTK